MAELELDDDDRAAIDLIAERILARMDGSVIPSSIPAEIGELVRATAARNAFVWIHSVPLTGPNAMTVEWRLNPDGTIHQEMRGSDGVPFWRGTFRPAAPGVTCTLGHPIGANGMHVRREDADAH